MRPTLLMPKPLLIALLLCAPTAHALEDGGSGVGGGGDDATLDFVATGNSAINVLDTYGKSLPQIDVSDLYGKWNRASTHVEPTDEELIDASGRPRCALNFPTLELIKVNRKCWAGMKTTPKRKMALALHEILGLGRYEGSGQYQISAWLFGLNPNELAYGRLALIDNKSVYRVETAQIWIQAVTDLERNTIYLLPQVFEDMGNYTKDQRALNHLVDNIELTCNDEGLCTRKQFDYEYEAQILPDRNIAFRAYVVRDKTRHRLGGDSGGPTMLFYLAPPAK